MEIKEPANEANMEVECRKQAEDFQRWVDFCAETVMPCAHTMEETERYFLSLYDTEPLAADSEEIKAVKKNAIVNFYRSGLKSANFFSEKAAEFAALRKSGPVPADIQEKLHQAVYALSQEAEKASAEQFGLVLKGYRIIRNERSENLFRQSEQEIHRMKENYLRRYQAEDQERGFPDEEVQGISVCFEMNSGEILVENGEGLYHDLTLFRGVCEEDVQERSRRFITYMYALRESKKGKFPECAPT